MAVSWKPSQKVSFWTGAYEAPGRDPTLYWLGPIGMFKNLPRIHFNPAEGEDDCNASGDESAQCKCHDSSPAPTRAETRGWHWLRRESERFRRFSLVLRNFEAAHNDVGDVLPVRWCERTSPVVCGFNLSLV
jgi:hypothetical protein